MQPTNCALAGLAALALLAGSPAPAAEEPRAPDGLTLVKAYADAMLEHGRGVYGKEHSPLFGQCAAVAPFVPGPN